jgi:hypothetical protein
MVILLKGLVVWYEVIRLMSLQFMIFCCWAMLETSASMGGCNLLCPYRLFVQDSGVIWQRLRWTVADGPDQYSEMPLSDFDLH